MHRLAPGGLLWRCRSRHDTGRKWISECDADRVYTFGFIRGSLTSTVHLEQYVHGKELRYLMDPFISEGELMEKLAEAAHDLYREGKVRDGWTYGPVRDDSKKVHNLLVPYAELPEAYKEANRTTVRNIARKLAAVGLAMVPAKGQTARCALTPAEIERMAEVEHELWMTQRIAAGVTLGPDSSAARTNPYLVPWEKVPEEIKVIDRDLVRGIPALLARAEYAVVRGGGRA